MGFQAIYRQYFVNLPKHGWIYLVTVTRHFLKQHLNSDILLAQVDLCAPRETELGVCDCTFRVLELWGVHH